MALLETVWSHVGGTATLLPLIATSLVLGVVFYLAKGERLYAGLPFITTERKGWQRLLPTKFSWITDAKAIQAKGSRECPGPFQMCTSSGNKITVTNRFANEPKAHLDLKFNEAFAKDFFPNYPGFEGMR